jgi:hypothetical protein
MLSLMPAAFLFQGNGTRLLILLALATGGGFMAGDALMYLGSFYAWLKHLAKAGVDCSILSVEYPLSPEHPFPCAVEAVAAAVEWLIGQPQGCDFIVGESTLLAVCFVWKDAGIRCWLGV